MQSPDQSYLVQHLRSIILHSLDTFNYNNADFACQRLMALDPTNLESIYLFCLTLLKKKRYKACYNYLIDQPDHLGCSYLFARSCLHLKKYKEGVFKLLRVEHLYNETSDQNGGSNSNYFLTPEGRLNYESRRVVGPDSSAVYHLLGDLYKGLGDLKNTALSYSSCLKYNQFDFEAFQKLAKLGVNVRVKAIYKQKNTASVGSLNTNILGNIGGGNSTASSLGVNPGGGAGGNGAVGVSGGSGGGISNPFSASPSNQPPLIHADDSFNTVSTPRAKQTSFLDAPLRRSSHFDNNSRLLNGEIFTKPSFPLDTVGKKKEAGTFSKITSRLIQKDSLPGGGSTSTTSAGSNTGPGTGSGSGAGMVSSANPHSRSHLKRNNSASMDPNASFGQGSTGGGGGHFNTSINGVNSNENGNGTSSSNGGTPLIVIQKRIENSERYLLSLYVVFAKGYKAMSRYDCYKAIRILEQLPDNEKDTPWVLSKLGRLHYEIVNYKQSEYFFTRLRQLDRTRLEDMEYYSTLLWHLHKKVELTYLANELYDLDSEHAITWCVIGNLFSLNREPDEAIKCFSKSTKLDESFTYAYTLKGHEYFSNDNYELALENFRISLFHDPRHYNALYGIGMIYINLGDYQKADYHFRKAVSINPINIILICCVGMVLEKLGKKTLALKQYELANKLQPLNPLPIFKKAQLLFSMQQFTQALKFFEILKDLAPDEASVHFLLGQLYKIHNDKFKAIREFTIALNLDPKGNYLIREAMESLKN